MKWIRKAALMGIIFLMSWNAPQYAQQGCEYPSMGLQDRVNLFINMGLRVTNTQLSGWGPEGDTYTIGLALHIVTDGNYIIQQSDLDQGLQNLENALATANISFVVAYQDTIQVGSGYDIVDLGEQEALASANNKENLVNIYIVKSLEHGKGVATFSPVQTDWFNDIYPAECERHEQYIFSNITSASEETLPHEMGHFLDMAYV